MYKKCLTKNQPKVGINMKSNKEEILRLYFKEKLKQVEISEIIGISKNAVSKVVKQDSRYKSEKNNRKQLSKKNHTKKIQTIVENKRKILKEKNDADFYLQVVPTLCVDESTPAMAPSMTVMDFCYETRTQIDIDLYLED